MQSKLGSAVCGEVVHMSREVVSPGLDTNVEVVGEWQDGVGEHVLTVHNCSGSSEALVMWR